MKAKSPVIWPLAGLVALVVLNAVFNPGFLRLTLLEGLSDIFTACRSTS